MKKYKIVVCVLVMFCSVFSFGQYEYNSFLCDILISENITDSLCVLKKDSLFHTKKDTTELPLEFPDTPPTFPGGEMNYMRRKFRFPLETIESGMVSGRIVVSFIVEKDGSVSDVRVILSSFDEHFNKKYLSTIRSMPKWKPGKNKNILVRTKLIWPASYDYR